MSRSLNHGYEDKCSEDVFNDIYNMAFERGKNNGIDIGTLNTIEKITKIVVELKDLVPVNRLLDNIIKDKPKELGMLMAYDKIIKQLEDMKY